MSDGRGRTALALVAGVALGIAAGWWLRGDAPPDAPASHDDGESSAPAASAKARVSAPRNARGVSSSAPEDERPPAGGGPSRSRAGTTEPIAAADTRSTEPRADGPRAPGVSEPPAGPGKEAPRAPAADTPPAATPAADVPPPAPRSAPPAREAVGVVVDAVTQKPVAGARVLYAIADGDRRGSWWGDTTGADGRFHNTIDDAIGLDGAHLEVRVSKEGYEPVRVPSSDGEYRVELRPRTTPVIPGRIVGIARSADGKPFSGELEVLGFDEIGGNASQRAVADASGEFVLEGVPPGHWTFQWSGARTEATVPEAGEARVEFAATPNGDGGGLVVTDIDPSKISFDDPKAQAQLEALRRLLAEVAAAPELTPAERERVSRALGQEVQILAGATHFAQPRRDVVVTGLATGGRAWLRLEVKPRQFWRVEVAGGAARFPPVPFGAYTAVLVEPGRPDRTATVAVPKGDGTLTVEFR
jgi:hypothetical protein